MEISRDALLRIVKATRQSMRFAEIIGSMLIDHHGWTLPDETAGNLKDALFDMLGESLAPGQQFKDSTTERLLTGDMSDEAVADFIIMKNRLSDRIGTVEQPKPNTIDNPTFVLFHAMNGGYMCGEKNDDSGH